MLITVAEKTKERDVLLGNISIRKVEFLWRICINTVVLSQIRFRVYITKCSVLRLLPAQTRYSQCQLYLLITVFAITKEVKDVV